jgi:hypothetical protein
MPDDVKNTFKIIEHFVVPESQNYKPVCAQAGISFSVVLHSCTMLTTIKLNDNPGIERYKIDNV